MHSLCGGNTHTYKHPQTKQFQKTRCTLACDQHAPGLKIIHFGYQLQTAQHPPKYIQESKWSWMVGWLVAHEWFWVCSFSFPCLKGHTGVQFELYFISVHWRSGKFIKHIPCWRCHACFKYLGIVLSNCSSCSYSCNKKPIQQNTFPFYKMLSKLLSPYILHQCSCTYVLIWYIISSFELYCRSLSTFCFRE